MNSDALISSRIRYSDHIEKKVRCAIETVVAEGKTPSFYNVSSLAQIARSTLYRKPQLRALVETAREAAHQAQMPAANEIDVLKQENGKLREEIRALKARLRLIEGMQRAPDHGSGTCCDYAFINFPKAA